MRKIPEIKAAYNIVLRSGNVPKSMGYLKRSINRLIGLTLTIQLILPAKKFFLYITGVKKKSAWRAIHRY